jgi:hypothetical protein
VRQRAIRIRDGDFQPQRVEHDRPFTLDGWAGSTIKEVDNDRPSATIMGFGISTGSASSSSRPHTSWYAVISSMRSVIRREETDSGLGGGQ